MNHDARANGHCCRHDGAFRQAERARFENPRLGAGATAGYTRRLFHNARILLAAVGVVCLLGSSVGAAQELQHPPLMAAKFRPRAEVRLAAELAYAVEGERCARTADDVIGCTSLAFVGFEISPRYRLAERFSLGVLARFGVGDSSNVVQLAAEARVHWLGDAPIDPSLGLDAGAALAVDSVPQNELGDSESFVRAAPAFGASAAIDFAIGETVSLGLLMRATLLAFGTRPEPESRRPSYDTQVVFSGGVEGVYRFGAGG